LTAEATPIPQGAGAPAAAPANTGADLGGAFRVFEGGSELPVTEVPAAETPANEAPVFTREDLAALDATVGDTDGEEGESLDGATEGAEPAEEAEEVREADAEAGEEEGVTEEGEAPDQAAVPEDPADYVLPEVEGFHWDEAQRAAAMPYLESLHEQGASQGQVAAVMERYATQMAAIETLNRDAVPMVEAALVKEWGSKEALAANVATIKAYLDNPKNVSPDLAKGIRAARMPSGLKLANDPQFVKLLLSVAKGQPVAAQPTQPRRDAVSEEIARLENLMADDIGAYNNKRWETTGVTASERYLDLMRQQAKSTEAPVVAVGPEVAAEEAELEALMQSDIGAYQNQLWKNTGKTASDRAYELAKLRTKKR
jgi:hypothetical protein